MSPDLARADRARGLVRISGHFQPRQAEARPATKANAGPPAQHKKKIPSRAIPDRERRSPLPGEWVHSPPPARTPVRAVTRTVLRVAALVCTASKHFAH